MTINSALLFLCLTVLFYNKRYDNYFDIDIMIQDSTFEELNDNGVNVTPNVVGNRKIDAFVDNEFETIVSLLSSTPTMELRKAIDQLFCAMPACGWDDLIVETAESVDEAVAKIGTAAIPLNENILKKLKLIVEYAKFTPILDEAVTLMSILRDVQDYRRNQLIPQVVHQTVNNAVPAVAMT
jgi:hypothetical protein